MIFMKMMECRVAVVLKPWTVRIVVVKLLGILEHVSVVALVMQMCVMN